MGKGPGIDLEEFRDVSIKDAQEINTQSLQLNLNYN